MLTEISSQSSSKAVSTHAQPAWRSVLCHTHTYSGRPDHGGTVQPPESYRRLADWARRIGVDAIGMGSPYTPRSAGNYRRFDGAERDTYYAPGFDRRAVLDDDEVERMLAEAQREAGDDILFFLDNETPKGRFGHMWWINYHYDMPAWHDYDQPFDRWMLDTSVAGDDSDEPIPYERRPYLQILAIQRAHGALGVWAHPTSWWRGDRGQFITNIATEMPAHAIADGYLDGLVIMGYQPYRPQYLAVWHALLDRGYRVTGVAEMDCGLSDPKLWSKSYALLNHAWVNGSGLSPQSLASSFRAGQVFASSGPFINLTVDDASMGEVARTAAGQVHQIAIEACNRDSDKPLARLELVGLGGEILWQQTDFRGGVAHVRLPGLDRRGYLIARVFGAPGDSDGGPSTREVAISNPVYLHPAGQTFNQPMQTQVTVRIRESSPYAGGRMRFEDMAGELLDETTARSGMYHSSMPANGRITLVAPDGATRTDYLVNANHRLTDLQRYLYRGRFLRDFPSAKSGDVPTDAWQLDEFADAMRAVELQY